MTAHALPHDLAHEYFVLTPPGVESCFNASGTECSAGQLDARVLRLPRRHHRAGGAIIYANDPYVGGRMRLRLHRTPEQQPRRTRRSMGGLSHEHNESITDPELNAWFGPEGKRTATNAERSWKPANSAWRSARARRLALQPADQRRRVLLPAGVEQRRPQLPAAHWRPRGAAGGHETDAQEPVPRRAARR